MNKFLSLAVLALLPAFATANTPVNLVCESQDKSTLVVVEKLTSATAEHEEGPAAAILLVVKLKGYKVGERINLAGDKQNSTKGIYIQLEGMGGVKVFLAAAASKSPDEINVNGITTEVVCEGR